MGVKHYVTPVAGTKELLEEAGISHVTYLPFTVAIPETTPRVMENRSVRLLCVGKFVPRKDQMLLLQTLSELLPSYPGLRLTLIGEHVPGEYLRQLERFVHSRELDNIVQFKYNVAYGQIMSEYEKHDLFILPSYNEPAAFSLVEAMAHGLPIICSDSCGTQCYIRPGINGYVFKHRNAQDLRRVIELCIQSSDQLISMGLAGRKDAVLWHSPSRCLSKLNPLINA